MQFEETAYTKRVRAAGIDLDVQSIARGEIGRCRRAKEGSRNTTLHRSAIELVRCGIDPHILIGPALRTGLSRTEATMVVQKAKDGFSDEYGISKLDFGERWLEEWRDRTSPRLHALLWEVFAASVRQNNSAPFIVQADLDLGHVSPSTISRRFSHLHERGAIVRRRRGMGARGRQPNHYELRLPRDESDYISDA